jgi:hypothetical protein
MVTGKLGWRLADGCPQLTAASVHPGFFRPGLTGNAVCNLAPTNFARQSYCNEIDWNKALSKKVSANCAELILWTSRTGD